jgi:hypothetical protein
VIIAVFQEQARLTAGGSPARLQQRRMYGPISAFNMRAGMNLRNLISARLMCCFLEGRPPGALLPEQSPVFCRYGRYGASGYRSNRHLPPIWPAPGTTRRHTGGEGSPSRRTMAVQPGRCRSEVAGEFSGVSGRCTADFEEGRKTAGGGASRFGLRAHPPPDGRCKVQRMCTARDGQK